MKTTNVMSVISSSDLKPQWAPKAISKTSCNNNIQQQHHNTDHSEQQQQQQQSQDAEQRLQGADQQKQRLKHPQDQVAAQQRLSAAGAANDALSSATLSQINLIKQHQQQKQKQKQKQHQSNQQPLPQRFPNNTLLEDLSKCHEGLNNILWPSKRTFRAQTCIRNVMKQQQQPQQRCKFQMPETIKSLNLNQKDYDQALNILTSDVRFKLHILLYRRVQTIWTMLTTIFCILLPVLLFTNLAMTIVISSSLLVWLGLQLAGALMARNFRRKLDLMLEKAVAQANSYFMDHNLMLGVINVGSLLTKSRLCIPMLYFDTTQCKEQIESIISVDCRSPYSSSQEAADGADGSDDKTLAANMASDDKSIKTNNNNNNNSNSNTHRGDKTTGQQNLKNLNIDNNNTSIIGSSPKSRRLVLDYTKFGLSQKEPTSGFAFAQSQLARKILLRYSQRWISHFDKLKLMFIDDKLDEPRHLSTGKCLCQFVEEHFRATDDANFDGDDVFDYNHKDAERYHPDQSNAALVCSGRNTLTSIHSACSQPRNESDESEAELNVEDCCSTDGLTDMMMLGGYKRAPNSARTPNQAYVQIDISKLLAEAAAASNDNNNIHSNSSSDSDSSLKILIPHSSSGDQEGSPNGQTSPAIAAKRLIYNNYHQTGLNQSFVPTLSQIVGMKQHGGAQSDTMRPPPPPPPLGTDLERHSRDSISPVNTEFSFDTTTDGLATFDVLVAGKNNDNLIQRLKDLLEMRKNELNSSSQQQQQTGSLSGEMQQAPPEHRDTNINTSDSGSGNHLKKFLSQTTDGLAFLGSSKHKHKHKHKQHQRGFYIQQQQTLEIC